MAINPLIPLSTQTPDIGRIYSQVERVKSQRGVNRLRELMTDDYEKQSPLRDAQQAAQMTALETDALYNTALGVKRHMQIGGPQAGRQFLEQTLQRYGGSGGQIDQILQGGLQLLDQGQEDQFMSQVDQVLQTFAPPAENITLSAGAQLVDPRTGQVVAHNPKEPGMDQRYVQAYMQANPGASEADAIGAYKALGRPQTNVTVNGENKPTAFQEATDKAAADSYTQMQQSVAAAPQIEMRLNEMERIAQNFETGRVEDVQAAMGAWLGTEAGSARDVWRAQQVPVMLSLAESIKGPMTEREWDMLRAALPNFGHDPRATKEVLRIFRKGIALQRANFQSATEYSNTHGHLRGWEPPAPVYSHKPLTVGRFQVEVSD